MDFDDCPNFEDEFADADDCKPGADFGDDVPDFNDSEPDYFEPDCDCGDCDDDGDAGDGTRFADPGGRSALRAAGPGNPRNLPCPTCKRPNMLTPADVARSYQCDQCSDRDEGCGY